MRIRDRIVLGVLALSVVFVFAACEQKETKQATPAKKMDTAAPASPKETSVNEPKKTPSGTMFKTPKGSIELTVKQTVCPNCGGPISDEFYADYQGKRVYFCCDEHKQVFLKDPQKYLAMLPQFGGTEPKK